MSTGVPGPVRGGSLGTLKGSTLGQGPWVKVALLDSDRRSLHDLNSGVKANDFNCFFSSPPQASPYLVLFLSQFKSPIVRCTIKGKPLFGCVDSGAQGLLLTHSCAVGLFGDSLPSLLTPYGGPRYLDAQHNTMQISGVIKNQILQLGFLDCKVDILVYNTQESFKEALIGFDVLKRHNIAIFPKGLKLQCEDDEASAIQCNRLSPPHCAYFPLTCSHALTLSPGQSALIQVTMDCSSYKGKHNELSGKLLICHSEDVQEYAVLEDLFIYYQYVWTGEGSDLILFYKNTSSEDIILLKGQLCGHAEEMYIPSNSYISESEEKCEFFKLCRRLLQADENSFISQDIEDAMSQQELGPRSVKSLSRQQINCQSQNPHHKNFLNTLLKSVEPLFGTHAWDVATICGSEIDLQVKPGTVPVAQRPYKIPLSLEPKARKLMSRLLELNLVRPSTSNWASNVIVLKKRAPEKPTNKQTDIALQQCDDTESIKTNKLRLVFDNREVNKVLLPVRSYPLSTIQDIMHQIHGAALLGAIDMVQGFWGHSLTQSSAGLFAFNWCGTLLEPRKLTQGVCFAPQLYQQKLHNLMVVNGLAQFGEPRPRAAIVGHDPASPPAPGAPGAGQGRAPSHPARATLHQSGVAVYLDNLIIHASDEDTYKVLLSKVFHLLLKNNYKVKLEKSHFFLFRECILFGFHFSIQHNSVRPEQSKIDKILNIPRPSSKKQLKSFIGLISFYQSLCPKFQHIAAPLTDLTSASVTFKWTKEAQLSFEALKRIIATRPLCYLFNRALPVIVFCDGCIRQYVAHSCYQYDESLGQLVPLLHYSKKLNKSQGHFSQYLCELYSILIFVTKQQHLIYGSQVTLLTDCISLSFAVRYAGINSTLCRWLSIIKAQNLKIFHLPAQNPILHLTDLLTRNKNELTKVNRKLTQSDALKLPILDFFNLPPMTLHQVEEICSRFYSWWDKVHGAQCNWAGASSFSYPTPDICQQISPTTYYHYCARTHLLSVGRHPQLQVYGLMTSAHSFDQLKAKLAFYFPALSMAQLVKQQSQDDFIKNIIKKVNAKKLSGYTLLNGLLCKTKTADNKEILLFVLPASLALPLVKQVHEKMNTFHLGFPKLAAEIKKVFVVKNLFSHFQKVLAECVFCTYNFKSPNTKLKPGLGILLGPRMAISFDVCEVQSRWGNGAFLTICDPFTLFCTASAIQKPVTAEGVVAIISRDWIRHYGVMNFAIKDNEKGLTSSLIDNVLRLLRIQPIYICPQNSTSNSHAERLNHWLTRMLACLSQQIKLEDKFMDIYLSFACLAWNSSINIFHGHSPALLHTGFQPKIHNFVLLSSLQAAWPLPSLLRHFKALYQLLFLLYNRKKADWDRKKAKEGQSINKEHLQIGDCVVRLLPDRGQDGRPGWKLRQKYGRDIFKIVKVGKVSCKLLPWSKQVLFQSREKGRGKVIQLKVAVCHKNQLKKVSDPLAMLYKSSEHKINRLVSDMDLRPSLRANLGQPLSAHRHEPAKGLCDFFATVLRSPAGAHLPAHARARVATQLHSWSGLNGPRSRKSRPPFIPSDSGLFTLKSDLQAVQGGGEAVRENMYFPSTGRLERSEGCPPLRPVPNVGHGPQRGQVPGGPLATPVPRRFPRQSQERPLNYKSWFWHKLDTSDDDDDSYQFHPTNEVVDELVGSIGGWSGFDTPAGASSSADASPPPSSPSLPEVGLLGDGAADSVNTQEGGGILPSPGNNDSFHSLAASSSNSDDITINERGSGDGDVTIVERTPLRVSYPSPLDTIHQSFPTRKSLRRTAAPAPRPPLPVSPAPSAPRRTSTRGRIILSPKIKQAARSVRSLQSPAAGPSSAGPSIRHPVASPPSPTSSVRQPASSPPSAGPPAPRPVASSRPSDPPRTAESSGSGHHPDPSAGPDL